MDVTGAYCLHTAGNALKRTLEKTEGGKKDFSIFLLIYGISPSWDSLDQILQEYAGVMAWIPAESRSSPGWSKEGRNPTFPLEGRILRLPSKAASPRERGSVGVLRACRQSPGS